MELSGLIFVALALVWAVVLIPKALRHHDELAETRSVEEVSDGMRVLARREAVSPTSSRLVVPAAIPAAPTGVDPVTPVRPQLAARAHRAAAAAAARRRRRALLVILVAVVGTAVAGVAGYVPSWAPAVPAAVVAAFLVVARVTVRREEARWRAYLATSRARAETVDVPEPSGDHNPSDVEDTQSIPLEVLAAAAVVEAQSVLEAQSASEAQPVGEVELTTDAGSLWDPLPVTLPTYVGKPRATRSVRTIDLTAPDVANAGRDAAASALVAEAATATGPDEPQQRVVGG